MRKHELLIPVGNMESVFFAIHNGADAIYLGMKSFGARAFAKNFDEEEIVKVIKYAHLYSVRVYVTMNTLVKDNEVEEFLKQIEYLYFNNVDAVIMQDFGMISLVREKYPDLEIHASTQANNSSIDTIRMFHNMGVRRVVVSREMSIDEINSIDIPIEIETFIHGALCISYSGNCLMSSGIGNRSGNRGECAGSCRLKYSLYHNDDLIISNKYLLSTKELNSSFKIKELMNSRIDSFKIEGRMKSPSYVGFITKFYRNLMDGVSFDFDLETRKLMTIFNRDYTTGNLFNSDSIINRESPNHKGINIGKVISVNDDKITIKLNDTLNQEDGIRFMESNKGMIVNFLYDNNDKLINSSNDIVVLDNKVGLTTLDSVNKTIDKKLNVSLENYDEKKIAISFILTAFIGNRLRLSITDGVNKVDVMGSVVEKAKTSSMDRVRIIKQLSKLGNTPFKGQDIDIEMDDDIFISIKELNDLRREACDKLKEVRENVSYDKNVNEVVFSYDEVEVDNIISCSCYREDQLNTLINLGIKRIYVRDYNLYSKYDYLENVYYYAFRNKFNIIDDSKYLSSEIYNTKDDALLNYSGNVTNIYTMYYLKKLGFSVINLSVELSEFEVNNLISNYKEKFGFGNFEILGFGRVENMIIKGNILDLDNSYSYKLVDLYDRNFPVYYDSVNTHVLNFENRNIKYKNISNRLDFYDEDINTIKNIVKEFTDGKDI